MAICDFKVPTSKAVQDQLDGLNEALAEADSFIKAFEDLGEASWVYAVSKQIQRLSERSESLERVLRQRAIPLLEDFDSVRAL